MTEKEPQPTRKPSTVRLTCEDCDYKAEWKGSFWEVSDGIAWLSGIGLEHARQKKHKIHVTTVGTIP